MAGIKPQGNHRVEDTVLESDGVHKSEDLGDSMELSAEDRPKKEQGKGWKRGR